MRPVVYIAGPYRHPSICQPGQQDCLGITQNTIRAAELAHAVWMFGGAAVCPHLNAPVMFQGSLPDEVWLDGDLAILARCEAVLTTPDWERSEGARFEVQLAEHKGIPVFGDMDELRAWMGRKVLDEGGF